MPEDKANSYETEGWSGAEAEAGAAVAPEATAAAAAALALEPAPGHSFGGSACKRAGSRCVCVRESAFVCALDCWCVGGNTNDPARQLTDEQQGPHRLL